MRTWLLFTMSLLVTVPAGAQDAAPGPASADDPPTLSSVELIEDANDWNGQVVRFTGEAVGEPLGRGEYRWIHLNDDPSMLRGIEEGAAPGGANSGIAAWVPADLADRIAFFGDYGHKGDIVEISGLFHAACPEHGGDLDLHAVALNVVASGRTVRVSVDPRRVAWAAGLLAVSGALFLVALARRRRERRPPNRVDSADGTAS